MAVTKYLALPREMTAFERGYLTHLNKIALAFFYLHIPALMVVAWAAETGPLYALSLSLVVMIGPTIAYRTIQHPRSLSIVYGVTAMLMGGLLVHFGQGPVQIEMHFYFFALLAMLCMFANPLVNMAAAVTVALHHLIVWLIAPRSVFNYEAQWWVVLVHAAFVVLETVAACYISRQFFDNVIGLEKIVAARTNTIREKQRDMRLILDHVETGLITIDLEGRMSSECSRVVEQWFGIPVAGQTLAAWLGTKDATYGEWLALALESVAEGTLPPDVALGQLPTVLKDGDHTYAVQFQLIMGPTELPEKILVIMADITERLRKEASERYQAELLELFQHIMRDKAGFVEFLTEADGLMASLQRRAWTSDDELKRIVHTLKGNCAIFGMRRLSEMCHQLELAVADNGAGAIDAELAGLHAAWRQVRGDLGNMLGERRLRSIEIDEPDYEAVLARVREGVDASLLARMIESWRFEPARNRLARIEQQTRGLAERMGKSNVAVTVEASDLRLDSEYFASFWSAFVHVLRNAVDHGVEDEDTRQRCGKPAQSSIRVAARLDGDHLVVSVTDDGPGVNWDVLRARAEALGVSSDTLERAEHVIFVPGVTSKQIVTEVSGCGVGMGAVREACEALGGTVAVDSRHGAGTRISFVLPRRYAVYEGHAALLTAMPASA